MTRIVKRLCDMCSNTTSLRETQGWESYNWFLTNSLDVSFEQHDEWDSSGRFTVCSDCRQEILLQESNNKNCDKCNSVEAELELKNDKKGFKNFQLCLDCSPFSRK